MNRVQVVAIPLVVVGLLLYVAFTNSDPPIVYDRNSITSQENRANEPLPPPPPAHLKTPSPVRAIYMTSWVGGTRDWRSELVDFVDRTELNSIVIDVKDYSGGIAFPTGDTFISTIGAEEKRIPDIKEFIQHLHSKNIYVIARITAFQDPIYSKARPDEAVQDARGGFWKDKNGLTYVDPLSKNFWAYIVHIARVSEQVGFDELNFDYIRYPSDGPIQYAVYPMTGSTIAKADAIEEFFQYLHGELADTGVPLSADLFGFTTYYENDLNIGQILERAEPYFDYIAPMVYPSHYPNGFNGYKNPAAYPYEIVHLAMTRGSERLTAASSTPSKLRPWIQDFDLGADYDAAMIQKEMQAVYDAGLDSWMVWDPANRYTRGAYQLSE